MRAEERYPRQRPSTRKGKVILLVLAGAAAFVAFVIYDMRQERQRSDGMEPVQTTPAG